MKSSIWVVENEQRSVQVQVAKAGRARVIEARALRTAKLVYPDIVWYGAYWLTNSWTLKNRDMVILDAND